MSQTPTIAQLRRETRALLKEADMPVGLGAVLRLYALKLDAIADGPRHKSPAGCGHLHESHGRHGCELCSTCQFVPVDALAALTAAKMSACAPSRPSLETGQDDGQAQPHDCVTDHQWPTDPPYMAVEACECGREWYYFGRGMWTDNTEDIGVNR